MKTRKKTCGGCQHWTKWKHTPSYATFGSDGLCELKDWRCSSSCRCEDYRPIPYKRERK